MYPLSPVVKAPAPRRRDGALRCCLAALSFAATGAGLPGANQTAEVSPIGFSTELPFRVELRLTEMGGGELPTLHSFAKAVHDGRWVILGGRTNGLHGGIHDFSFDGLANFPPAHQNREVVVVDPATGRVWRQSLGDPEEVLDSAGGVDALSGLRAEEIDALAATNSNFYQDGERLYIAGGYGYDHDAGNFVTYPRLMAIDLPGLVSWATAGPEVKPTPVSFHLRTLGGALFQVTGGAMERLGERTLLVFGQDFVGPYNFIAEGFYTQEVRSFEVLDDAGGLRLAEGSVVRSGEEPHLRRRDLNVARIVLPAAGGAAEEPALVALSGVFTETDGAFTVPVEIRADGVPRQADPESPGAFKQGMNNYHCAKVTLFSRVAGSNTVLLFGGIGLQYFDPEEDRFVTDMDLPFVNQCTALVRAADGGYRQVLLDREFPAVLDDEGRRLRFGAGAEFFPAEAVPTVDGAGGVVDYDALGQGTTTLGYIFGGIVSDRPHEGRTAATNAVFQVDLVRARGRREVVDVRLREGNRFAFTFTTEPGRFYQLQSSDKLHYWTDLGAPEEAAGETLTLEHVVEDGVEDLLFRAVVVK